MMGFLDRFFGSMKHPELDPQSEAAMQLQQFEDPLRQIVSEVHDRLEVVTGKDGAFVFVGKPPRQFGVMWIENGKVQNLKSVATEQHLDSTSVNKVVDRMRQCYSRHQDEQMFTAQIADHEVVVHPSDLFEHEMEEIIHEVVQ